MTEEQANKIIQLLEKLVEQTTSLDSPYTLEDVCSRLDTLERVIKK